MLHSQPLSGLSVAVVIGRRSPQRRGKICLAGGTVAIARPRARDETEQTRRERLGR
jgi:hypothetical protein